MEDRRVPSSGLALLMSAYEDQSDSSSAEEGEEEDGGIFKVTQASPETSLLEQISSDSASPVSSPERRVSGVSSPRSQESVETLSKTTSETVSQESFELKSAGVQGYNSSVPAAPLETQNQDTGDLYTEDMFERYDGAMPNSLTKSSHHRHSIYSSRPLPEHTLVVGGEEEVLAVEEFPAPLKEKEEVVGGMEEETVQQSEEEMTTLPTMDVLKKATSSRCIDPPDQMKPSSLDDQEIMMINKENLDSNDCSIPLSATMKHLDFTPETSLSSNSQDSEKYGLKRHDSNLSSALSSTPVIKEEMLEYTDGGGQFFYVQPDESQDIYKSDCPTYLPEQEFTSLCEELKRGTVWNKVDSTFSSVLHNLGLIHRDAATAITKLPSIQKSKIATLVKSWSDQKAFTDCLVEMTDCDHFYDPIGYDTVLVTDPCMSAKYDSLTNGLNQQEVERKQLDEFYNFTEEKSFFFQKCKVCNKLFSNTFGLRQHIAHMHPNVSNIDDLLKKDDGLYSCLKCKKAFNCQAQLKKHFKKMHVPKSTAEQSNFKCSHCGEFFKTRVLLHRHTSDKHRNRSKTEVAELHEPWSCELCKSIFYKKGNFLRHMQKIHGKLKVSERLLNSAKLSAQLVLPKPLKEIKSSSPKPIKETKPKEERRERKVRKRLDLSDDTREQQQEIPVAQEPEPVLPKMTLDSDPSNIIEPIEVTPVASPTKTISPSKQESEVNVTCLFCKLCFVSYTDLQLHCADVHREANKIILLKMFTIIGSQPQGINFQCILCTRISPTPPVALGHLESVHLTERQDHAAPPDIPAVESAMISYISPQLADFDGLSLICRFCQKKFKNSKIKRKHEKSVHNDQTIVCFYCFIPILNRTELTKHIKSQHSGSKSLFKCRWCDAHFTSIPKRCAHMKEYHSSDVANISTSKVPPPPENTPEKVPKCEEHWRCDKCNISFNSADLKTKHDRCIHNEVDVNCLYCFTSFRGREALIQHIAVYHSAYHKKPYKCKWCEITFETLYQRSLHMKHCHGVPSLSPGLPVTGLQNCADTSQDDISEPATPIRKGFPAETAPVIPFQQSPVSAATKETSKLVRNCRFCDAEVTSMILKKHLIEHRQWDHFCCIFCDKTVPTIGGIKSHILRNHPFITSRKMNNSELDSGDVERVANIEKYHKSDALSRRAKAATSEPPPPRISPETEIIFPCQICFFLYTINDHAEHHWKEHGDEKADEWTCTLCDEQYGEFKSFKFHVDMHLSDAYVFAQSTVDLQNICGYCNITIDTQQALDGHILIHRSVEQFNCIFCKAKSLTFRELKEHISQNHLDTEALANDPSRHLNETPFNSSTFKCSICLKLCNNQFNLNSHTKAHILGGKPCSLCKFKFKDMATLKRHLVQVHGASAEYIMREIEQNTVSRSDAVPDYCELCDKTFSSQGKFQKHRKACRERYRNATSHQNGAVFSLLDTPSDRSRNNSEKRAGLGETVVPTKSPDPLDHTPYYDTNDSESSLNQAGSMDELEGLPMEIPMKSGNDAMFPTTTTSPHSYNTRKRPRPESYTNIIPAKMLSMSYTGYATARSDFYSRQSKDSKKGISTEVKEVHPKESRDPKEPYSDNSKPVHSRESTKTKETEEYLFNNTNQAHSNDSKKEYSMEAKEDHSKESKDNVVDDSKDEVSIRNEIIPGEMLTGEGPSCGESTAPRDMSSGAGASKPPSLPETMFCDICELHFASNKQLYWHKHTKRHLAMVILAKGPAAVSHGKHPCDQCDQGYNCKKQLKWHKKIAHDQRTNLAEIVMRQPQLRANCSAAAAPAQDPRPPKIPCTECDAEFTERPLLDAHYLAAHGPNSELPDQACHEQSHEGLENGEILMSDTDLLQPIKGEDDEDKRGSRDPSQDSVSVDEQAGFNCTLCQLTFKTNKQLYNHKRTLAHIQLAKKYDPSYQETHYTCDECGIDFQSYKQLWNHKKCQQHRHTADKQSVNPELKPLTRSQSNNSDPESEKRKNFVCLDCDCVFEDKQQMKWHRKTWNHKTITIVSPPNEAKVEEPPPPAPPKAPLPSRCSKGLLCTTANPCKHHALNEANAPYTCQECKLPFRALRAYTVHCKMHLKEGFKCTLCNQKFQFKNYNNVKRHLTNIHKIANDRTKNYMETFHNFDRDAQPLQAVNPADLAEGAIIEPTSDNPSSSDSEPEPLPPVPLRPPSSEPRSPSFVEGLLANVGLTLEIVERKPEWIESSKCKFCKLDFENVPEMLLHVYEEHNKNYYKEFLTSFIDLEVEGLDEDSTSSSSSEDEKLDNSLSDVEEAGEEELEEAREDGEIITPGIRIKRPGENLSNGPAKKTKIGFGSRVSVSSAANESNAGDEEEEEAVTSADDMMDDFHCNPKRQYVCILCNTRFTQYLAWWYHSKLEHNFSNVGYYGGSPESKLPGTNYESSCKKNVNAECPECQAVFNQRLLLEDHLKIHRKPKIFQCDFCCKKFNSCKNASRHRLKCHCVLINGRKNYLCKSCECHFPRAEELIEHVQSQHESAPATFCCVTCGKVYNKESTFVSHIRECDPEAGDPEDHMKPVLEPSIV